MPGIATMKQRFAAEFVLLEPDFVSILILNQEIQVCLAWYRAVQSRRRCHNLC